MKGLRQIDGSIIWEDGGRTYPPATGRAKDPAGTYPYPPAAGGIPVEVANENPGQLNPGPLPPPIQQGVVCVLRGKKFPPSIVVGNLPPQYLPGSLMIVWEDGSGEYAPQKGAAHKPLDPPGSHIYPPSAPGLDDVTKTIPCPSPWPVITQGPFPPSIPQLMTRDVDPLPPNPSAADLWDRWQKLVANWACLIAWGGGDLDKLTVALGDMPIYPKGASSKTAVGWWRDIQIAGYDKAATLADLGKGLGVDANDVGAAIGQLNDLGALARSKGYAGCPVPPAQNPATPPSPPGPVAMAQGWWGGLSRGGKVVTGAVVLGVFGLIIRGAAK